MAIDGTPPMINMEQHILGQLPHGVIAIDHEHVVAYCNRQASVICHLDVQEALGQPLASIFNPRWQSRQDEEQALEALSSGTPWKGNAFYRLPGGADRTLSVAISPLWNEARQPIGHTFTLQDITEDMRQVADQNTRITTLQQQYDELRIFKRIVDNTPDGLLLTDMDGQAFFANSRYLAMHGIYDETFTPFGIGRFLSDEASLVPIFNGLKEQGVWEGTLTLRRYDTTTFPAHVTAILMRDSYHRPQAIAVIEQDISERMSRENDLNAFKLMADYAPDLIGMLDVQTHELTYVNRAYTHQLGYAESLMGVPLLRLLDQADGLVEAMFQQCSVSGGWQGTVHFRRADGTMLPTLMSSFVLYNAQHQPMSIVTIAHDLTEQQRHEAEQREMQERVIRAQHATLRELSTPLIPISDKAVIMPLIGAIDSIRASQIMDTLLDGIAAQRATLAIIDITGVRTVDTHVADVILQAARAVRLLGAEVVITGIQPDIASTLVTLQVDLRQITTRRTLQDGIVYALRRH